MKSNIYIREDDKGHLHLESKKNISKDITSLNKMIGEYNKILKIPNGASKYKGKLSDLSSKINNSLEELNKIDEMTTTTSSGAYEAPLNKNIFKREISNMNELSYKDIERLVKEVLFERAQTMRLNNTKQISLSDIENMMKKRMFESTNKVTNVTKKSEKSDNDKHYKDTKEKVEKYHENNMSFEEGGAEKSNSRGEYHDESNYTDEYKASTRGKGVLDFDLENADAEKHQKRIEDGVKHDAKKYGNNNDNNSEKVADEVIKGSEIRKEKRRNTPHRKMNMVGDYPFSTPSELNERNLLEYKDKFKYTKKLSFKKEQVSFNEMINKIPETLKEHKSRFAMTDNVKTLVVEWMGMEDGYPEILAKKDAKIQLEEQRKFSKVLEYERKSMIKESNVNKNFKTMLSSVRKLRKK